MARVNRGKQFEKELTKNFLASVPDASIDRIYDVVSGNKGVTNICDFIAYSYPNIFYIEAKTHYENTFPWTNLTQYDKLVEKVGIKGVRVGVVLWMIDHDIVVYLPIKTVAIMKRDGTKSFNIKMLKDPKYSNLIHAIPGVKKRVFMECDYSVLCDLKEGE